MNHLPSDDGAGLRQSDYHQFMIRELLIWVVGVPIPIAAVIGFFVL